MKWKLQEVLTATKGELLQVKTRCFSGVSTDSRTVKEGELFIALKGKSFDAHDFLSQAFSRGAGGAVIEKDTQQSFPGTLIKVKDTLKALGELASYLRQKRRIKVIMVTGSCGKTTTREMIKWTLSPYFSVHAPEKNFNNRVGLPLTLLSTPEGTDWVILEGGINQFGEMEILSQIASPDIGIITNIYPVHLQGLKTLKQISQEKAKIAQFTSRAIIFPENAPYIKTLLEPYPLRKITFGLEKGDFIAEGLTFQENFTPEFKVKKTHVSLSIPGYPPVYAALCTMAVSEIIALPLKEVAKRLSIFPGVEGRLQLIKSDGIEVLNDTYNSNPQAMKEVLKILNHIRCRGKKVLVMGEMKELGKKEEFYHRQLGKHISRSFVETIITIGNLTHFTYEEIKDKKESYFLHSTEEASSLLRKILRRGDIVAIKGSRALKMEALVNDVLSLNLPA
ncbi:MAG: UDP-N-acetylmuramoyl-tripeptide--D-alanyl-D-alanine ligase [Caldiserica bacterium]|nr:UDP-N-acetylmuramoyl-tripeptide--D-alanyl-D-alanine ligase [Caldisericota bacterium]